MLALDGGGLRGIVSAAVLTKLEDEIKEIFNNTEQVKHLWPDINLSTFFQGGIVGTSTGSLIAAGLYLNNNDTNKNYTASEILKLYEKNAKALFVSGCCCCDIPKFPECSVPQCCTDFFKTYCRCCFRTSNELTNEELVTQVVNELVGELLSDSSSDSSDESLDTSSNSCLSSCQDCFMGCFRCCYGCIGPRYSNRGLRQVLGELIGSANMTFESVNANLGITTYQISPKPRQTPTAAANDDNQTNPNQSNNANDEDDEDHFSEAMGHPGIKLLHKKGPYKSISIKDAVMASAAAPTYFPAVKIVKDHYVDGGLFMNSPIQAAIYMVSQSYSDLSLSETYRSMLDDDDFKEQFKILKSLIEDNQLTLPPVSNIQRDRNIKRLNKKIEKLNQEIKGIRAVVSKYAGEIIQYFDEKSTRSRAEEETFQKRLKLHIKKIMGAWDDNIRPTTFKEILAASEIVDHNLHNNLHNNLNKNIISFSYFNENFAKISEEIRDVNLM